MHDDPNYMSYCHPQLRDLEERLKKDSRYVLRLSQVLNLKSSFVICVNSFIGFNANCNPNTSLIVLFN